MVRRPMNHERIPPLLLDLRELPEYPSNVVLRSVLVGLGAEVIERPVSHADVVIPRDATLVVPYPAHRRVIRHAVSTIGRNVTIIAVPLVLLNDSRVADRRELPRYHPRAIGYRCADLLLGRSSSLVVSDTATHAEWMSQRLHARVAVARLGSAVEQLRPDLIGRGPAEFDGTLRVVHYGNFFPLQGVDTMLEAMAELGDEYQLDLIGNAPGELTTPQNVRLLPARPAPELYEKMTTAHGLLGQFGETPQRSRVIPTKVYDACALGLPIITSTGAELDRHRDIESLDLIGPADVEALVSAAHRLRVAATMGRLDELGRIATWAYDDRFSVAQARADWQQILCGLSDAAPTH